MQFSRSFFIKSAFILLSITGYGLFVFAAAPTGGYIPGQTNDPSCAPGDTDCVVNLYVTTATNYTWVGTNSGQNNGSTDNTVFVGIGAGDGATSANYSNFVGTGAGQNAVNANNSNFFGQLAGCNATNADNANFFGQLAGCYATNANNSNFFGYRSGYGATNADHSTFFGDETGESASSAYSSVFIGASAGYGATNAYQSNFFGREAGYAATGASDSSFLGYQSGYQATNATGSFFAGNQAGYQAYGADTSVIIGNQAGYNTSGTPDFLMASSNPFGFAGGVNFLGYQAGYGAEGAVQATFIGTQAGYQANTGLASTIIGFRAGYNTNFSSASDPVLTGSVVIGAFTGVDTIDSSFNVIIGNGAGSEMDGVLESLFIGHNGAGSESVNVYRSMVVGTSGGDEMVNVNKSVILGTDAGDSSSNMNHAIVLGPGAGRSINFNNTFVLIGYTGATGSFIPREDVVGSISNYRVRVVSDTGSALEIAEFSSSLIPGETITGQTSGVTATVLPAVAPASTNIVIGTESSSGGYINSIALGTRSLNTAAHQFMIGSTDYPIDEVLIRQSGGNTCSIQSSGMLCSSDERQKTNISDMSTTILDTLTKVRTVTYNWRSDPEGKRTIGFIAQDLEQYFPELVHTDELGKKSVNYALMTPLIVESVRELSIKMSAIETVAKTFDQTMVSGMRIWFADTANGIGDFFAKVVHSDRIETKQLCVGSRCISEAEFNQLLDQQQIHGSAPENNSGNDLSGNSGTSSELGGGTNTEAIVSEGENTHSEDSNSEEVVTQNEGAPSENSTEGTIDVSPSESSPSTETG